MIYINRWNHDNHGYVEEEFDNDKYNLKTFSNDMEEIIHCPHCLHPITYGSSYTSLEYHTPIGIGYCVCKECHKKEVKRKRERRNT